MFFFFIAAVVLLVSYFFGCINGSVMTSHFIIKDDVRKHGSGNAGLTNFYRTYGAKYALLVIAIDMGKTVVAVLIGGFMFDYLFQDWTLGVLLAGLGCELGHMFPVFFGFRGGKGILSGGALSFFLDWRIAAVCWGLFLILCLSGLCDRNAQRSRYCLSCLRVELAVPDPLRDSGRIDHLLPQREHQAALQGHRKQVQVAREPHPRR